MSKKTRGAKGETSTSYMDMEDQRMDLMSIRKDVEKLGSIFMTWKERKEFQNRKVVSLGGKPPKKQRLPLSVARVVMKKQKERDQKMLQENMLLGRFGMKQGTGSTKKVAEKRKPEDRVLKSTVGHFRDGVLDVKQLLKPAASRSHSGSTRGSFISFGYDSFSGPGGGKGEGKKKKGGKKKHNKKGGGRKRH